MKFRAYCYASGHVGITGDDLPPDVIPFAMSESRDELVGFLMKHCRQSGIARVGSDLEDRLFIPGLEDVKEKNKKLDLFMVWVERIKPLAPTTVRVIG